MYVLAHVKLSKHKRPITDLEIRITDQFGKMSQLFVNSYSLNVFKWFSNKWYK